ncbi:hypothetical protein M8C21_030643 [Ambrosia artemisiifolia]|uniref:glutathione transferase n=1 Tax=Ambrosia artemisiifolia TaxID=4212 RepID=A0AAD5G437_AMBAR|nr:hypothetical protein M8C21_030643 [Ambrosia artemisiifolia]
MAYFCSHAILIYLSCKYPGVASHWYPSDLKERAKVHSVLDWHHANLRRGSVGVILNNVIYPLNGIPSNPQAAEEAEKTLEKALVVLETFWLKDGPFLVGRSQPSIADLNLVSEVMALDQLLSEELHDRILSPYKKVLQWVEDTKTATAPHFEEIHEVSLLLLLLSRIKLIWMLIETFYDGILAAIVVPKGESAPVGAPFGLLADTEAEIEKAKAKATSVGSVGGFVPAPTVAAVSTPAPAAVAISTPAVGVADGPRNIVPTCPLADDRESEALMWCPPDPYVIRWFAIRRNLLDPYLSGLML